ncbi:MAG: sulfatase family protein [Armatimonadota bacterium]
MPNRPRNLLIIMSDDQGSWAMGCAGTPELHTPNLDRLAAEGIRFTNYFCTSPVCSPARASFLTGRIPSQHGIHDYLEGRATRTHEYLRGMSGFTDLLAEHGYRCGHSGKWHMGDSGRPQKGNRFWCAHSRGGGPYRDYDVFDNSPEMEHKTQYVTDFFTDRALDFLEEHGRGPQPFCLNVHYTAPHTPWGREHHPAELFALYEDCAFDSVPDEPRHPWARWTMTPEERREGLKGYFAAITGMDRAIGRLLDRLTALGLREDTLVIFLSDNGMSMGHHGFIGKGNGTLPLNMYDTSVKVPFIVACPGAVPHGMHDGMWSHYDVRPTILDYFGIPDPEAGALSGRSFAAVLEGKADAGRDAAVVFDEYGPTRMIRERAWKYVHRYPYGPHELYNLADDPDERTNLVDDPQYKDDLIRLRGKLEAWFLRYIDPARDGARQPVEGGGQIDFVGPENEGRDAFMRRD